MSKHFVGSQGDINWRVPRAYAERSEGYAVRPLVGPDTAEACVMTGVALARLEPGGHCGPVFHAFERGFYVLEGEVVFSKSGTSHRLGAGHYMLVGKAETYGLYNPGSTAVQWFEVSAPQPKPEGHVFPDTFFPAGEIAKTAGDADLGDPRILGIGYFDHHSLKGSGDAVSAAGARSDAIHGIALKEMIDRIFGSRHLAMFLVQFMPGGGGSCHDHPHEEVYYLVSGRAYARLDGVEYDLKEGDFVWTGAGCLHEFSCAGNEPVRWIETQAPLPAEYQAFRFLRDWETLAKLK